MYGMPKNRADEEKNEARQDKSDLGTPSETTACQMGSRAIPISAAREVS
jgi:hypothetical protein